MAGGLLETIKTDVGQTVTLVREDGQTEPLLVVSPGGGVGGAGPAVWFVDKSAPAGGVGSIAQPFNTFAAAVAAASADFASAPRNQQIWITPADYQAEGPQSCTLDGTHVLTLAGWNLVNGGVPPGALNTSPLLPKLTMTAGSVTAVGVTWIVVAAPAALITPDQIVLQGAYVQSLQCDKLTCLPGSQFNGGTITTFADVDNSLMGGNFTCATALIHNTRQSAPVQVTGNVQIDGFTNAFGTVTATGTLTVLNSAPASVPNFTGTLASGGILAGGVGQTAALTLTGTFPYGASAKAHVCAVLQFDTTNIVGVVNIVSVLQVSLDGGGTWVNGSSRPVEFIATNNPQTTEVPLVDLFDVHLATADARLRIHLANNGAVDIGGITSTVIALVV